MLVLRAQQAVQIQIHGISNFKKKIFLYTYICKVSTMYLKVTLKKEKGFTLIEVMIVVAIVAILALIAFPSYESYQKKTKRSEAKTELIGIANIIEKQKIGYKRYNAIPLNTINMGGGSRDFPSSTDKNYTISVTPSNGANLADNWTLTATPANRMAGDGALVLNRQGHKCWTEGATCSPSASSDWN